MSFMEFFNKNLEDQQTFEVLIKNEQEKLYKVAYSYVRNEQDALDIVQDTVIKGLKSFHKLKDIQYFSTWITRILIHSAIDHLRRRKNVIPLEIDWADSGYREENSSVLSIDIANAFETLNSQQKTLILLRFYYGYSIAEISEIMEKPQGTIKSQLHRTLQLLKQNLEKGGESYGKASAKY